MRKCLHFFLSSLYCDVKSCFIFWFSWLTCYNGLRAERNPFCSKLPFVKVFYHQNKNRNKVVPNLIGLSSLRSSFASGDLFCWLIHKYIFIWLMCSMSFKLNHFQKVDSKLNVTNLKTITIVNYVNLTYFSHLCLRQTEVLNSISPSTRKMINDNWSSGLESETQS